MIINSPRSRRQLRAGANGEPATRRARTGTTSSASNATWRRILRATRIGAQPGTPSATSSASCADKQKLVLAETGTSGVALATFFAGGRSAAASLLNSCRRHTTPVKPEHLGLIGGNHLLEDCCKLGAAEESFRYKRHLGTTAEELPYAIEAAFACPDESWRQLITGVNFSVGIGSPFARLGPFDSLAAVLGRQHVNQD